MPETDFPGNTTQKGKHLDESPRFFQDEGQLDKPTLQGGWQSSENHSTWQQILLSPAPYKCDLSVVSEQESPLGKLLRKGGEQSEPSTWGSDPLLGWVFGTLNILSRTVTLKDMRSYNVELEGTFPPFLMSENELRVEADSPVSISELLTNCYTELREDPKRLIAAIARQAIERFSDSPEFFGVTIPQLCERTPKEIADSIKDTVKYSKCRMDAWNEQWASHDYASLASDIYADAQSIAGTAADTIERIQSYLDEHDGAETANEVLEEARDSIAKAQEYMENPIEMYSEYTSVPSEYLSKAQEAISSSRERINEAHDYIRQAYNIIGIVPGNGEPLSKLFDKADNLLGGTEDFTNAAQDMLSNPQSLLKKVGELAGDRQDSPLNNELVKMFVKDFSIIGLQTCISVLINAIIRVLHTLCYDSATDGDAKLYEVRTRKILSYSNAIASGSNVIYVALSKDVGKLDIGGIAVTIYRIVSDHRFIQDIKREFLSKQWYDIVMGDDEIYKFLEDN
jgi:gas vesicle protein